MAIEPVLLFERERWGEREREREREREAAGVGYRPASWTMEKDRSQHPPDYHAANDTPPTPLTISSGIGIIINDVSSYIGRAEIGRTDSAYRLQIAATTRSFRMANSPTVLKGHRYGFATALL